MATTHRRLLGIALNQDKGSCVPRAIGGAVLMWQRRRRSGLRLAIPNGPTGKARAWSLHPVFQRQPSVRTVDLGKADRETEAETRSERCSTGL